ncbi:YggT family protein [Aquimonas voraii]|uniref:YggT family protein n=1 Tax=Aquimonas voraii TaxID=265719 RepID=A0A1G6YUZ5_9GAMM|nr:YggT family protein [Aquimonas voraii]SDD94102.1 YggT family protein [Aquimonas voraii]
MSYFAQAGVILIEVLIGLFATLFVLRVALPLARANFYNPICQFVYRATHPVVTPLRRALRPIGRFETSAAAVAWLIVTIKVWAVYALLGRGLGLGAALVVGFAETLGLVLWILFALILVRVILSFIQPAGHSPALPIILQLTEPLLAPLRRLLPNLGGFDFSPLLAMLLISLSRVLVIAPITDLGLALAR